MRMICILLLFILGWDRQALAHDEVSAPTSLLIQGLRDARRSLVNSRSLDDNCCLSTWATGESPGPRDQVANVEPRSKAAKTGIGFHHILLNLFSPYQPRGPGDCSPGQLRNKETCQKKFVCLWGYGGDLPTLDSESS